MRTTTNDEIGDEYIRYWIPNTGTGLEIGENIIANPDKVAYPSKNIPFDDLVIEQSPLGTTIYFGDHLHYHIKDNQLNDIVKALTEIKEQVE